MLAAGGSLKARLLEGLTPELRRLVEQAARLAHDQGVAAYVVGGAVRDLLVGRPVADVDVVVVGDAGSLARRLAGQAGGGVVVFDAFGTARVEVGRVRLDLAGARTERYPRPGALPQPRPAGAIEDDLFRRDFTINAMAIPLAGDGRELVDPWGGYRDLQSRRLRALHPQSFIDDPTRLFRAVRLSVRYGLRIEPKTRSWMRGALAARAVEEISAERRGAEVRRCLSEHPALPAARAFERWGLWDAACPTWRLLPRSARALAGLDRLRACDPELLAHAGVGDPAQAGLACVAEGWLAVEPRHEAERVNLLAARLALTRQERRALASLQAARRAVRALSRSGRGQLRPSTADRLLAPLPGPALAWVAAAGGGADTSAAEWVKWYVRQGRHIRPRITGRQLLGLGCPAGPMMKELLARLRAAVLDGRIREPADEVAWVKRQLGRMRAAARQVPD